MRIFRRTPVSEIGASFVLLFVLLCFQGVAFAQNQWPVFIFNEEHKPSVTDRETVLVSVRNQGDYSSEPISANRRYWREHLGTDSLSWLGIDRKARPLLGKAQCFYTLVRGENKKIAFLEYTFRRRRARGR